jgi:hypothetical protein
MDLLGMNLDLGVQAAGGQGSDIGLTSIPTNQFGVSKPTTGTI